MGEITTLHPSTKWAQRRDRLWLTIELSDCQKPDISLDSNSLRFSAKGGKEQKTYTLDLKFHQEVNPEECKQNVTAREICFNIKKKEEGPYWPRLLKDAKKPSYLHTDFSRWRDEDDSEEEDTAVDDNFEAMMNQMGGAGGQDFDPGDVNSDDSDDEGLPDLES
ncbi:prostaglandin E synthase 3-like [Montipora foliosa]|uniref:prostaglandin E synthase 3-like n=1 Tax=Montipora foliosa TaxID=591990 RepID=UPI0035F20B7C